MAKRIHQGALTLGGAQAGMALVEWDDAPDVDRSRGDNETAGDPIITGWKGSGRITMLEGHIASGHASGGAMSLAYTEKTYAAGVESTATKTAAFTKVTISGGGSVGAEGRGECRYSFEYGLCSVT